MKNIIYKLIPDQILRSIKSLYLFLRGVYYRGNKYECPICEHKFRTMLPGGTNLDVIKKLEIIGAGYRENNICPYCQSTDRDRLVYIYLKEETNIFTEKVKVLHLSPEPALYNKLKQFKNILYVTGTKYAEGIYYHKDIESVDLLDLPFADGDFDMVICNHVLEHIIDDTKAISEIYRVLTNGGSAILQVPISHKLDVTYEDDTIVTEELREKHFGQFDHVRIYGNDYGSRLEKEGFFVSTYQPDKLDENIGYALNKKEKLFVAGKKL